MASASAPLPARVDAVAADVVDPDGLGVRAAEVAARQRSPQTRRTYAAVYRSLLAFLGEHASVEDLTAEAVRAYRDALEDADRTPATIAKHLSAIRGLAAAVGADADVRTVRSASVARGEPRALSHEEYARLLKMPDRRTSQGRRDLALLHLLGSAGLRRSEAAALVLGDIDERRLADDPRLRHAIKGSTSWWVTVRYAKRGRSRVVPLDDDTLEAIVAWVNAARRRRRNISCCRCRAPAHPARSALATSRGLLAATPSPPTCPTTGAPRTFSATRSARTSRTPVPTPP